MTKISGKNLIDLGFTRVEVTPEESGQDKGYHYYVFEVNNNTLLISSASDEKKDGGYLVEFFNMDDIGSFSELEQIIGLTGIINSLKK